MKHRRCWLAVACVSALLTARPAAAQSVCQAKESVSVCLERLEKLETKVTTEVKAEAAKVQADVKKKTET